jgi:hypothetical protein
MDASRFVRVNAAALCAAAILLPSPALSQQRNLYAAPVGPNDQRVALVIGNAAYDGDARLKNPVNDANDLAAVLRELRFDVTLKLDADWREMDVAIEEFEKRLSRGGVGLFYFAGHGIETNAGKNYLIPTKSEIKEERDLRRNAIEANSVLERMERAGSLVNIFILDACRNNPLARSWRSARTGGLAPMSMNGDGTFLAYATGPGRVALDGDGKNGIFTKHLVENLRSGESDLDGIFNRVIVGVAAETRGSQRPWKLSNLPGFRFRNDEPTAGAGQINPREQAHWTAIRSSRDPQDFDKFLVAYPSGYYAGQARDYRTKLIEDVKRIEAERARLEEERRQDVARVQRERLENQRRLDAEQERIDRERRENQARIEAEQERLEWDRRRQREEELRLQRARELERQRAEQEKKRNRVYVPPTF